MTTEQIGKECLIKMFRMNGIEVNNIDEVNDWAKKHGDYWFCSKPWGQERENEFRDWMREFLKKHTKLRKAHIESEIGWFLLMWGWKTK